MLDNRESIESIQDQLADLITQLLMFCDADLNAARAITNFVKINTPDPKTDVSKNTKYLNLPLTLYFRYTANLLFSDALLILSSLLEKRGLAREQSITLYLLRENRDSEKFLALVKKFDEAGLRSIRDQYIAHKDPRMVTDAHGRIFSSFKEEYLSSAETIFAEVKAFCHELFPRMISNNYINGSLDPAVKQLLDLSRTLLNQLEPTPSGKRL